MSRDKHIEEQTMRLGDALAQWLDHQGMNNAAFVLTVHDPVNYTTHVISNVDDQEQVLCLENARDHVAGELQNKALQ